ncbi:hypothetical protein [Nocardioides solisilvae]|uniref:FliH/SctL family protein n=1 Tax=Nocardioides solisilvae TaxID=1542435 RepID=UPI0013A55A16|nr:hypothetical protein [Nocardioides solisilvae]
MSSSTEAAVVAPVAQAGPAVTRIRPPELRRGEWTRLGPDSLLGDPVAEHTLSAVAEQARAAAQAQGYTVGWAQGRREAAEEATVAAQEQSERWAEAERERAAEHAAAVAALTAAADQLRTQVASVVERLEVQGTELAWALTTELLGREVAAADGADVVRRVLALAPGGPVARVHLAPGHLGHPAVADLAERGVAVVADPALGPVDAVVEVEDHALDLRLEPALARVREALR